MSDKSKNLNTESASLDVCGNMKVNLINAGKFIELGDAIKSLQAYFNAPGTPPRTDPAHIYGHTFGLNNLRSLLFQIDQYNGNLSAGKLPINGVRIYYGIDKRDDSSFPLNPPTGMFRDLIFMPVLEDGNDLYPVDPGFENTVGILGNGRPCPNQCSFTFLDRK